MITSIRNMKKLLYLLTAIAFVSCEKDEIPRAKPTAGSADVVSVTMGGDYANQLFYNLEDKKVVSKNNREIWDLGFESSADGFHVVLNGAKLMAAAKTSATNLADVTSDADAAWAWDMPSGNFDSTAIGDWRTDHAVYIIDRGTSTLGTPLGKMKLKILSVDATKYEVEWAGLEQTTSQQATVTKNASGTFTYFSFNNGQTLTIEPAKETWDICFTSYTHVFEEDHTPYLVTGVISNRYGVKVKPISNKTFANINYTDYLSSVFDTKINNIGYNWKVYDFDVGVYTVDMSQNFIIETADGRAYKLHFLDFYDDFGVKGTPTMELQELVP